MAMNEKSAKANKRQCLSDTLSIQKSGFSVQCSWRFTREGEKKKKRKKKQGLKMTRSYLVILAALLLSCDDSDVLASAHELVLLSPVN